MNPETELNNLSSALATSFFISGAELIINLDNNTCIVVSMYIFYVNMIFML